MKPSINKVIRDLLNNKSRSFIVLLAIVLGAFGVSMMTTAYNLLGRNLSDNFLKTNPASFTIVVDSVSESVLDKIRSYPDIESVETRNRIIGRVEKSHDEFVPIWLYVVDDFEKVSINKFRLLNGTFPQSGNEVLVERTGDKLVDISINKEYAITIPGSGKTNLKISGIVHDPGQAPSWMEGLLYGYISTDLVKQMKIRGIKPELKFIIRNHKYDLKSIEKVLAQTELLLKKNGIGVTRTEILTPGRHIHQSQMDSLMFLLQMFGVLSLILSCFLIINMMMAIMAKEIRQIGVMKAIGASTGKITAIYLTIVMFFGFTATLISLPLGFMAGKGYAGFVASMLNFELFNQNISAGTWLFQIAIGTLLPALVSIYPVYQTSRISVREALNDFGVKDNVSFKSANTDKLVSHLKVSNSTLLAFRNTFRRKGRLLMTLITLVLGGAVFISAFNIRTSLKETVKSRFTNQRYDIQPFFASGIYETDFRTAIDSLPFVADCETWGYSKATRIITGRSESEQMDLKIAPLKTTLFVPEMVRGRWLSGNAGEVVANHMFFAKYPDVKIGNDIILKVNGRTKTFKVVGCNRELFSGTTVYVSKSELEEWPAMKGKMNSALIAFNSKSYPDFSTNSNKLEQWFRSKKYPVTLVFRKDEYKERVIDHLVIITSMLIMVTILLVIVGGLGLITTMNINIIERLRELSVLRAIGVTNKMVYQLVITEGFIIGLLSWVIALVVSVPISIYLGNKFFKIFFETTLNFSLSVKGIVLWLAIIVGFSTVAVLIPARNAIKLSISEGLGYE